MDNNQKINALDGIKGICACIIASCWHYQHFTPAESPFYSFLKLFYDYGYLAVEMFFVFSGFGMTIGYESRIIKNAITID